MLEDRFQSESLSFSVKFMITRRY